MNKKRNELHERQLNLLTCLYALVALARGTYTRTAEKHQYTRVSGRVISRIIHGRAPDRQTLQGAVDCLRESWSSKDHA
jgi:hypothetical protein